MDISPSHRPTTPAMANRRPPRVLQTLHPLGSEMGKRLNPTKLPTTYPMALPLSKTELTEATPLPEMLRGMCAQPSTHTGSRWGQRAAAFAGHGLGGEAWG